MRAVKHKARIGELLIQNKIITETQLGVGLEKQKQTGQKIGQILVELGYIEEIAFLKILSQQLNIPFVDLKIHNFDVALIQRLPEVYARRFKAIILSENEKGMSVGMADPMDISAYDQLSRILQSSFEVVLVREKDLLGTLDLVYRRTEEIANYAEELDEEITEGQFDLADLIPSDEEGGTTVIKLLESIFEDAVQVRASDIHIEPDESVLRIRQRVDGVLHEQIVKEKRISGPLVLRLKLMAGLNISEKRLPQDGRFSLIVKGRKLDIRVSTLPIEHGESVVLRLLDQSNAATHLGEVGMPEEMLVTFRRLIKLSHGLILVTGPTGSGKTTTLYGALQELNEAGKKIITVEDPVEYRLPRINQVQVNPKIDLSFARVLRAALRQDPDIILVGEIRDGETAEIALRAAMTGHLVLSSLHTNDALSSAMRLIDMGSEGFLAASSLRAVMAQRLVRRLCETCATHHELTDEEKTWLDIKLKDYSLEYNIKQPKGCHHCNNSGYRGRIGVFELLVMNDALSEAMRKEDSMAFINEARRTPGFEPLVVAALKYAVQGVTSLEEVFSVAQQINEAPDFREGVNHDVIELS